MNYHVAFCGSCDIMSNKYDKPIGAHYNTQTASTRAFYYEAINAFSA